MFITLIVVASLAKAFMDASAHGSFVGHAFWDETIAWRNKWKNGDKEQGERWFTSSTVTVFVTSGWHLSQFVFLNALIGSVFFYSQLTKFRWVDFLIVSVVFRVGFECTYRLIKEK